MVKSKTDTFLLLFVVVSITTSIVFVNLSKLSHPLLPADNSIFSWKAFGNSDSNTGGASSITINDDTDLLGFEFKLQENDNQYSYASLAVLFSNYPESNNFVDWSQYSTLKLKVLCEPHNLLLFAVNTFDNKVTSPDVLLGFRPPGTTFSCDKNWNNLTIDLNSLDTPEWWLLQNNLELTDKNYTLNKIQSFSITNTVQSPLNVISTVKIAEATLIGTNRLYSYSAYAMGILACGAFVFWIYIWHTRNLLDRLQRKVHKDESVVLQYQPSPMKTKKDRDKNAVIRFISSEYANPDLSLETVVSALGVNRLKINDILKETYGLTFSTYLNKLRLTEASRLLLEKDASVSEAAYSVGYRNPSYFNRIFKKEYGCTPNTFKKYISANKSKRSE